jgi:glycosyl transferase family 25
VKSYVINLDHAAFRWDWMRGQAEARGIALTRFSAIDGDRLSDGEIARHKATSFGGYSIGKREIGCYLSHRALWKELADSEDAFTAIFEDDVHFGAGIRDLLSSADWIPADADIIRLETFKMYTEYTRKAVARTFGRDLYRLRGSHYGLAGYILRREAARFLLANISGIGNSIDAVLFSPESKISSALLTYQLVPAPVIQNAVKPRRFRLPQLDSGLQSERLAGNPAILSAHLRSLSEMKPRGWMKLWRHASRPAHRLAFWLACKYRLPLDVTCRRVPFA